MFQPIGHTCGTRKREHIVVLSARSWVWSVVPYHQQNPRSSLHRYTILLKCLSEANKVTGMLVTLLLVDALCFDINGRSHLFPVMITTAVASKSVSSLRASSPFLAVSGANGERAPARAASVPVTLSRGSLRSPVVLTLSRGLLRLSFKKESLFAG